MTFKFPDSRIAEFAREPILGKVKTRLLAALGEEGALALYQQMLARIGSCIGTARLAQLDLWVTSNPSHESFLSICNEMNIYVQEGDELGEKMAFTCDQTLVTEAAQSMLIVGTDCPVMDADYLEAALSSLQGDSDVVIGPAEDGGYVLIGMRQPQAALFADISWGSERVLAETLARAKSLHLNYHLLPTLWDVDTPADLPRLQTLNPSLTHYS
jgi:hypothetical protein